MEVQKAAGNSRTSTSAGCFCENNQQWKLENFENFFEKLWKVSWKLCLWLSSDIGDPTGSFPSLLEVQNTMTALLVLDSYSSTTEHLRDKAKLGCRSPSQAADFSCPQCTSHLGSTSAGLAWCWRPCWTAAGLRRTAALWLPPLTLLPALSQQTLTHYFHFRFAVSPNLLLALKKHAVSREPAPTGVLTPPTPANWNSKVENWECLSAACQRPLHNLRLCTDAAQHMPICQLCSGGTVQIKDSLKDRQRELLLKFPSVLPEDIPQCYSCDLADSVQLSDPERMVLHFLFFLHHWLTVCFLLFLEDFWMKSEVKNTKCLGVVLLVWGAEKGVKQWNATFSF